VLKATLNNNENRRFLCIFLGSTCLCSVGEAVRLAQVAEPSGATCVYIVVLWQVFAVTCSRCAQLAERAFAAYHHASQVCYRLYAVPRSCRIDLICFLAWWSKRSLNQALVSFALVCAYVGSFRVWLFRFVVLLLCPSHQSDWLRRLGICCTS